MSDNEIWPCPNGCLNWCRIGRIDEPMTNHHPNCEYVDKSLINVWKINYEGGYYYDDNPSLNLEDFEVGTIITIEKIHREIYEQLKEFEGF